MSISTTYNGTKCRLLVPRGCYISNYNVRNTITSWDGHIDTPETNTHIYLSSSCKSYKRIILPPGYWIEIIAYTSNFSFITHYYFPGEDIDLSILTGWTNTGDFIDISDISHIDLSLLSFLIHPQTTNYLTTFVIDNIYLLYTEENIVDNSTRRISDSLLDIMFKMRYNGDDPSREVLGSATYVNKYTPGCIKTTNNPYAYLGGDFVSLGWTNYNFEDGGGGLDVRDAVIQYKFISTNRRLVSAGLSTSSNPYYDNHLYAATRNTLDYSITWNLLVSGTYTYAPSLHLIDDSQGTIRNLYIQASE